MRNASAMIIFASATIFVASCTKTTTPPPQAQRSSETPQSVMLNVAKRVQACWFKKKDPALKPYRMASELDSYSGKPRILIVPRRNPGGLPKLVAQAERISGRVQFSSFGPLLSTSDGPRLNASLRSWANGSKTC